ncbi:hypothetical protein ACZ87_02287 [Candidatus Erwinia dacicola]|uniref:Uncharacterized protein n=1 Tax=Candidatus Erwinia dacicola TaxID=252393 RepID=A0A328TPB1_9GAMM|nr:hypothetical protein ACZ87_02287 [Candidatus Erwinia dacicola]
MSTTTNADGQHVFFQLASANKTPSPQLNHSMTHLLVG